MVRIVFFAVSFLLTYVVFSLFFNFSCSLSQWDDNLIKAEEFMYGESDSEQVMLGSSLTARLSNVFINKGSVKNLGFGGQSVFDGIEILKSNKKKMPKVILIEMNVVERPKDDNFQTSLFGGFYQIKKSIPAVRTNKKPLAVLSQLLNLPLGKFVLYSGVLLRKCTDCFGSDNSNLFEGNKSASGQIGFALALQQKEYNNEINQDHLDDVFLKLRSDINVFRNAGSEIVFYEMPINYKLTNSKKCRQIRNNFYRYFPQLKFNYVSLPSSTLHQFKTTDGIHLDPEEAKIYEKYLNKKLEELKL